MINAFSQNREHASRRIPEQFRASDASAKFQGRMVSHPTCWQRWSSGRSRHGNFQKRQRGGFNTPWLIATALSVAVCASTQTSLGTLGTRVFREVGLCWWEPQWFGKLERFQIMSVSRVGAATTKKIKICILYIYIYTCIYIYTGGWKKRTSQH